MVFVNGVKQYANERAEQRISFNSSDNLLLSSTARTFLNDDSTSYTLEIGVDGGSRQTLTAVGSSLQFFQDIVDEINSQITGVTATWNFPRTAIDVYSDTTGTGSQINIVDFGSPIGSTLLGALATVPRLGQGSPLPGTGSPLLTGLAYTHGNIAPAVGSPVNTVVQNIAYYEAGSPVTTDAMYGQLSSTVVFNSQQQPGDVIELLYEPVSE